MPHISWTESFLDILLKLVPTNINNVLDVGCGRGILGSLVKIYREPKKIVGLDIYDPYLIFSKSLGVYDSLIKHDLNNFPYPFQDDEFDIVIGLEVIEHLSRPQSKKMLSELERIARRVIISTPNLFFNQPHYDNNPFQEHLCKLSIKDFNRSGYAVFGVGDLHFFGVRPMIISYILGRATLLFPRFSTTLLAIKDRSSKSRSQYVRELRK